MERCREVLNMRYWVAIWNRARVQSMVIPTWSTMWRDEDQLLDEGWVIPDWSMCSNSWVIQGRMTSTRRDRWSSGPDVVRDWVFHRMLSSMWKSDWWKFTQKRCILISGFTWCYSKTMMMAWIAKCVSPLQSMWCLMSTKRLKWCRKSAPMIGLRTSTMMKIERNVHLEAKVESEWSSAIRNWCVTDSLKVQTVRVFTLWGWQGNYANISTSVNQKVHARVVICDVKKWLWPRPPALVAASKGLRGLTTYKAFYTS